MTMISKQSTLVLLMLLICFLSSHCEASARRSLTKGERKRRRRAQVAQPRNHEYEAPSTIVIKGDATGTKGKGKGGTSGSSSIPYNSEDDGRTTFLIKCKDGATETVKATKSSGDPVGHKASDYDVCDDHGGAQGGSGSGSGGTGGSGSGGSSTGGSGSGGSGTEGGSGSGGSSTGGSGSGGSGSGGSSTGGSGSGSGGSGTGDDGEEYPSEGPGSGSGGGSDSGSGAESPVEGGAGASLSSCEEIAAGNGPQDGDSLDFSTTMDIIIESDLPLTGILKLMQADLQFNVAPVIADCIGSGTWAGASGSTSGSTSGTGGSGSNSGTGGSGSSSGTGGSGSTSGTGGSGSTSGTGGSGSTSGTGGSDSGTLITNVVFGEVEEDDSGCSAEYSEDADELGGSCYKTVIPADVYYSGDDIAGIVARIQDAIDGHEWNVPGLMKVSPVDRDNGGVSAIQQNRSEEEDDKIGPAGFLAVAAAALVLLLLAVMVARRRRRDEIVKHVELGDDDDTYLKDMEADSQGSSPSRVARVVGEDDSVGTGWASSRAGDFPMDGYFTNLESRPSHQDVHVCSSATCDVCESRRRAGIQFVPTGTPSIKHPPMPPDSPRQYAADDTVCL